MDPVAVRSYLSSIGQGGGGGQGGHGGIQALLANLRQQLYGQQALQQGVAQQAKPAWQQLRDAGIPGTGSAAGNRAMAGALGRMNPYGGGESSMELQPLPMPIDPNTAALPANQVFRGIEGDPNTYTRQPDGSMFGSMIGRVDGGGYGPDLNNPLAGGARPRNPAAELEILTGGGLTPEQTIRHTGLEGRPFNPSGPPTTPRGLTPAQHIGGGPFPADVAVPAANPGAANAPLAAGPSAAAAKPPGAPAPQTSAVLPAAQPPAAQPVATKPAAAGPPPPPAALGADGFKGPNANRLVSARRQIYNNVRNALRGSGTALR